MPNPEHVKIFKQGAAAWNKWRRDHNAEGADLSATDLSKTVDLRDYDLDDADLRRANLRKLDLREVGLHGADLRGAHLIETNLSGMDLSGIRFYGVALRRANLVRANLHAAHLDASDLRGADLTGANLEAVGLYNTDLRGADLTRTDLTGAILASAKVGWTNFDGANLGATTGLDALIHRGPSRITLDTIYRSRGRIGQGFLKKAGAPASLVHVATSLANNPRLMLSCTIAYAPADRSLRDHLVADLAAEGIEVWDFPRHADWVRPTWDDRATGRDVDKVIVICSHTSLKNRDVLKSIEWAHKRQTEHNHVLFPIDLDGYVAGSWKHRLRDYVLAQHVYCMVPHSPSAPPYDAWLCELVKALQADIAAEGTDIHDKYVIPYYLMLLHNNYACQMDAQARNYFAHHIASVVREADDGVLRALLCEENWQPKLVGAWFAGILNRADLAGEIARDLARTDCYTIEGHCVALARFATPAAIESLCAYLDEPHEHKSWALAALKWIDRAKGTQFTDRYLRRPDKWTGLPDGTLVGAYLNETFERFCEAMEFCQGVLKD